MSSVEMVLMMVLMVLTVLMMDARSVAEINKLVRCLT